MPICVYESLVLQPIADRVAQNLEFIPKYFQFSTRRTRILMGFIIYYSVLIVNPMGTILVCCKSFRKNLEIVRHPICNRLYFCVGVSKVCAVGSKVCRCVGLYRT